jgi:hypothetical protein
VPPSTDGTVSLANREIGRVLPANYGKMPFSGAVEHLNEAATARYFGQLSGESPEARTRWRSAVDSNSQATLAVLQHADSLSQTQPGRLDVWCESSNVCGYPSRSGRYEKRLEIAE